MSDTTEEQKSHPDIQPDDNREISTNIKHHFYIDETTDTNILLNLTLLVDPHVKLDVPTRKYRTFHLRSKKDHQKHNPNDLNDHHVVLSIRDEKWNT